MEIIENRNQIIEITNMESDIVMLDDVFEMESLPLLIRSEIFSFIKRLEEMVRLELVSNRWRIAMPYFVCDSVNINSFTIAERANELEEKAAYRLVVNSILRRVRLSVCQITICDRLKKIRSFVEANADLVELIVLIASADCRRLRRLNFSGIPIFFDSKRNQYSIDIGQELLPLLPHLKAVEFSTSGLEFEGTRSNWIELLDRVESFKFEITKSNITNILPLQSQRLKQIEIDLQTTVTVSASTWTQSARNCRNIDTIVFQSRNYRMSSNINAFEQFCNHFVANCVKLKKLSFDAQELDWNQYLVETCEKCSNLEHLRLNSGHIHDFTPIRLLSNLCSLELHLVQPSNIALATIFSQCRQIKSFDLLHTYYNANRHTIDTTSLLDLSCISLSDRLERLVVRSFGDACRLPDLVWPQNLKDIYFEGLFRFDANQLRALVGCCGPRLRNFTYIFVIKDVADTRASHIAAAARLLPPSNFEYKDLACLFLYAPSLKKLEVKISFEAASTSVQPISITLARIIGQLYDLEQLSIYTTITFEAVDALCLERQRSIDTRPFANVKPLRFAFLGYEMTLDSDRRKVVRFADDNQVNQLLYSSKLDSLIEFAQYVLVSLSNISLKKILCSLRCDCSQCLAVKALLLVCGDGD